MIDVEKLRKTIEETLLETMKRLPQILQAVISVNLGLAETSEAWKKGGSSAFPLSEATWSTSSRLRIKSGNLLRSFNVGRGTKISKTEGKVVAEIGSDAPYAMIHERGGFIASKGQMHKWFWAMYAKSKNPFFKIMALSVLKRGGVTIPKRAYIEPSKREFYEKVQKEIQTKISNIIVGIE